MTPAVTSRQSSQDVPHASVKHLPPSKHGQDRLPDRYNYDNSFCTTRDALVHTKVRKYFPDTASSRASSPRTTQSRTRDLSPLQGLPPQPICSQRFRTDQKRTLLRELRTIRIFRYTSPSLRFDNPAALPRQPLRRVSRLHRKRTPRQHSTRLLQMRRRLRRPSRVRLPTPLYDMIQSPQAWYQLWCTICTSFGLQNLVTDGCVHVKYVNDKKSKQ